MTLDGWLVAAPACRLALAPETAVPALARALFGMKYSSTQALSTAALVAENKALARAFRPQCLTAWLYFQYYPAELEGRGDGGER